MGNQTNTINNVELFHGEAKNAVNKGFLEAFEVSQGSDRLNLAEQMRSQKLGLRRDEKDCAHASKAGQAGQAGQAVKKEGLTKIEPFLTQIISINYRKEQS
jgi:hypothetical protein